MKLFAICQWYINEFIFKDLYLRSRESKDYFNLGVPQLRKMIQYIKEISAENVEHLFSTATNNRNDLLLLFELG